MECGASELVVDCTLAKLSIFFLLFLLMVVSSSTVRLWRDLGLTSVLLCLLKTCFENFWRVGLGRSVSGEGGEKKNRWVMDRLELVVNNKQHGGVVEVTYTEGEVEYSA
jgi:hypothetical protein